MEFLEKERDSNHGEDFVMPKWFAVVQAGCAYDAEEYRNPFDNMRMGESSVPFLMEQVAVVEVATTVSRACDYFVVFHYLASAKTGQ